MGLLIPCPHCGIRDSSEFLFGGELRDLESADPQADFDRVYLHRNAPGPQDERWFHSYGCRRWLTITRDTVTNRFPGNAG